MVLDIFEKTCGARMSMNYNVIGGVIADLHPDFEKDVRALIDIMPKRLKEYHKVFSGNLIAKNRMVGVGKLKKEDAINYDITGTERTRFELELRLPQETSVLHIRRAQRCERIRRGPA